MAYPTEAKLDKNSTCADLLSEQVFYGANNKNLDKNNTCSHSKVGTAYNNNLDKNTVPKQVGTANNTNLDKSNTQISTKTISVPKQV